MIIARVKGRGRTILTSDFMSLLVGPLRTKKANHNVYTIGIHIVWCQSRCDSWKTTSCPSTDVFFHQSKLSLKSYHMHQINFHGKICVLQHSLSFVSLVNNSSHLLLASASGVSFIITPSRLDYIHKPSQYSHEQH